MATMRPQDRNSAASSPLLGAEKISADQQQRNLSCRVVVEALELGRWQIFYLETNHMKKLVSWLFAAAFVLGLGAAPTLTYADQHEKDPIEEAEEGGEESSDDDKKESGE